MRLPKSPVLRPRRTVCCMEGLESRLYLSQTVFYVAPTGNDFGPGTFASPWQHVQYAIDQVGPGSTVFLTQGLYNEAVSFRASGQAGKPIVLSGYSTDAVVLAGTGLDASAGIDLGSNDYITIQKMYVRSYSFSGSPSPAIVGQGGNDGIVLQNLDLNQSQTGIVLGLGGAAVSHNILIDSVHLHDLTTSGIVTENGEVDGLNLRNSWIESDSSTGSAVAISGANIALDNTIVYGFADTGVRLVGDNLTLRRVTVVNCGIGIDLDGTEGTVENSLSVANTGAAMILTGSGPYTLSFNLLAGSLADSTAVWGNPATPIAIAATGNILTSSAASPLVWLASNALFAGDYNLYYAPSLPDQTIAWAGHAVYAAQDVASGAWAADSGADAHSVYADPLLTVDYHLAAGSPAIDRAPAGPALDRDGRARPIGSGYDLGAYEQAAAAADRTAPVVSAVGLHNVTTAGAATYDFTVTYSDNVAVRIWDLDGDDVLVTGPNGFSRMAAFVSVDVNANGKVRTATYRIDVPGGSWDHADDGVYSLRLGADQVGDPSGNFAATRDLGSFSVNAFAALGRFGDVDGLRVARLIMADGDGTLVTFALSGHGAGVITASAAGGWDLQLVNTDAKTTVTITARNSKAPGDDGLAVLDNIVCPGALKSLTAKTTDLGGDLTVGGTLASLAMHDVTGTQSTLAVNGTGGKLSLAASFNRVGELSFTAPAMAVRTLTAAEWLDDDGTADVITALRLGSLNIKGSRASAIRGDFGADLVTADAAAAQPIGTVKAAGWIYGSTIRAAKAIGSVTAGGLKDSTVLAGIDPSISDFAGVLAAGVGAFTGPALGTLKVTGIAGEAEAFVNSSVAAGTIGTVSLLNVRTDNTSSGGATFGVSAHYLKSYLRKTGTATHLKTARRYGPAMVESADPFVVQLF